MSYPPDWRQSHDDDAIIGLMREYPFAHLITGDGGLLATRIPFLVDVDNGRPARLRAHLNAENPQAKVLEGADVLIVFSGPSTYVSPNWRTDLQRAATFDYQEVRVRGRAIIEPGMEFFVELVDGLARQIEPQYADIGDYPVWQSAMSPEGYIERLFPHIMSFSIEISGVEMISKLHQAFTQADRASIADHLTRSDRTDSRKIGELIRKLDD